MSVADVLRATRIACAGFFGEFVSLPLCAELQLIDRIAGLFPGDHGGSSRVTLPCGNRSLAGFPNRPSCEDTHLAYVITPVALIYPMARPGIGMLHLRLQVLSQALLLLCIQGDEGD
jgi:hypothetical protein